VPTMWPQRVPALRREEGGRCGGRHANGADEMEKDRPLRQGRTYPLIGVDRKGEGGDPTRPSRSRGVVPARMVGEAPRHGSWLGTSVGRWPADDNRAAVRAPPGSGPGRPTATVGRPLVREAPWPPQSGLAAPRVARHVREMVSTRRGEAAAAGRRRWRAACIFRR